MDDFTPDQTPFVPVWLDDYNVAPPPPAQGFVPGIGVPAEQLDQAAAQAAAFQPVPAPVDQQPVEQVPMVSMQPGLGIPAPVFDQAIAAPVVEPAPVQAMDPSGHAAQPMDPYADLVGQNPLDNPNLSQDDANAGVAHIARTDPYALAEIQQKHELAQQNFAATEALRISAEDRRRAEENHHTQTEATARANAYSERLMAEASAIGNTKIDTGRWFSNRTTGQRIAMALGAIAGGVVAGTPGSGGKNPFIEGMQHDIEQDIQAQQQDIANGMASVSARKGLVADIYARTGDLYQAGEVARVAMLTSSRNDLAAKMQLYDQRGTTALGYAKAISDVDGRIMAAHQKAVKDEFDRQKALLDMEKTRAEIAKMRAEASKLKATGVAKPKEVKWGDVPRTPQEWASMGTPNVPGTMSANELQKLQGVQKTGQEVAANANTSGRSKEERESGIPGIKNPDGSQFVAYGRAEDASKLRDVKQATDEVVTLMDEALRIRTGWTSDRGNSAERQKLKSVWGKAKLKAKVLFDLGAIAKDDIPLLEGGIGTDDPSTWKDPTEGILTARRLTIDGLNGQLHSAGWDANSRYDIAPPKIQPVKKTNDDDALEAAVAKDNREVDAPTFITQEGGYPGDGPAGNKWLKQHGYEPHGDVVLPMVRRAIDKWGNAAKPKTADDVENSPEVQRLRKVAEEGANSATREYAQRKLDYLLAPIEEAKSDLDVKSATSVRDTLAEPKKDKR